MIEEGIMEVGLLELFLLSLVPAFCVFLQGRNGSLADRAALGLFLTMLALGALLFYIYRAGQWVRAKFNNLFQR